MDLDQYPDKMKALHRAVKKVTPLIAKEQSQTGREILERYIKTCREELRYLRAQYLLNLRNRPENFNGVNAGDYSYHLNMGVGIMSSPLTYDEFMEKLKNLNGHNPQKFERLL